MKNSNAGCLAALFLWMVGRSLEKQAEAAQKQPTPETGVTKPWKIPPANPSSNPPAARPNIRDDGFDEGDVRHHYDY
jgi:hypothetical protein